MITPRISELIDKIDILNVGPPYDTNFEGTLVTTAFRNVWAKVEPLPGGVNEATMQKQIATQPYNIWIRYRDGVTAFQQITYESKRLVQTAPPEAIGETWLLIHAQETIERSL